ncbi:MAG: head-tail connector protein [Dehalococcoidales bacterium]|nr:head-tail connector protein [Dehalococcoidales bacterium]
MALKLKTAPTTEPVSLTEAKLHCRVEVDTDDTLITALIKAAREYCEGFQRRAYITQTWELWLDKFPTTPFDIPRPPLQSIDSINYYGTDDTEYEFEEYYADVESTPGRLELNYLESWPSETLRDINGVCITFKAGYGAAAAVPQSIKQAILLLVGHWYENRESVSPTDLKEIPAGVVSLLWMERNF